MLCLYNDWISEEPSAQALTEQQFRVELGKTLDLLEALPADAFAERSKLRDRQAELGRMLREIDIPGAEDIKNLWSEAPGSKSPEDKGKPVIISPMDIR